MRKKIFHSALAIIGFLLSPVSWWNDIVVNIPLAYLFSYPFAAINKQLFLPAFITGYLITNVLGFVLMHKGIQGIRGKPHKLNLRRDLLISLLYVLLVAVLFAFGILKAPTEYFNRGL